MPAEIENVAEMTGRRIVSGDDFGTVMFVGEVPPASGVWLGIEWDDPQRGRHDGSRNGIQYFQCRHPTGGSFLRPNKADFGRDIVSAIREKYIPKDLETGDIDESVMSLGNKTVEMIGAKKVATKQSSFENLSEVTLRCERISVAGDTSLEASNIKELNISKNLLPSWKELSNITRQLKRLEVLDISENRLAIPSAPETLLPYFSSLQELLMNRVYISWSELLHCASMWPSLRKLHVCFNNLTCIDRSPENIWQHLELMNLEGNGLQSWEDVLHLGKLPKLQTLILNSNELSQIYFNDVGPCQHTSFFPALKSISVNLNAISEWLSISELNKLQSLEEVFLKFNPITSEISPSDVRGKLIAKLRRLKKSNNSPVERGERRGAEIDYLKQHCNEWLESGGSRDLSKSNPSEEFLKLHPTYEKLLEIYGAPEEGETVVLAKDLKSTLIEVCIICPTDPSKKQLKKKLPGGMELQKLRSLIQKIYRIDVCSQQLYYTRKEGDGLKIKMDNDLRTLDFYGIESGDTIFVKY